MRLLYLANNRLGRDVLRFLREGEDEIAGLVLHPEGKATCAGEMRALLDLPPGRVFDGSRLREPAVLERLRALEAEMAFSVLFNYILRREFIDLFPRGVVNLHPSLLPYNRGQYPNVWSIVERTPAGVTLHRIDEGIDTGPILAQREVPVEPVDTGESLYRKLEAAGLALVRDGWADLRAGRLTPVPQAPDAGTVHRTRDVEAIDPIDLEKRYAAGELLDILRARTFPPYRGAWFEAGGRRVYVRVSLEYEDA